MPIASNKSTVGFLSQNYYYNTVSQSPFKSLATFGMPTLKFLLVMYNCLNAFYCETKGKYGITLPGIHDTLSY